jgi:hypothetical protein
VLLNGVCPALCSDKQDKDSTAQNEVNKSLCMIHLLSLVYCADVAII